ncbi:hypothetical protein KY285_005581 [Solanum tuberosum]|nr:hypothetical protein KY284_005739 [Solanum tuberosum]KAH0752433.1 hypothetical protein KY285_005581 [Solanum tuberosum]
MEKKGSSYIEEILGFPIYGGKWGENSDRSKGQKCNSPSVSKFKNPEQGQLDLHEISSQIPRNSDEKINVDSLDRTHRPCARRGAHPCESRVIFRSCCRT